MGPHSISVYLVIFSAWLTALFFPNNVLGQNDKPEQEFYNLYEQAIDKYHREDFDEALRLATLIREKYPHEPAGAFGLMATYQTMMRNYRVKCFESKFDSLLNLAVKLSKTAVKKNKRVGRNYFYLACAYGSRSVYNARRNKWLEAFRDGSQVPKNFKRTIAYNPEFYDAYYGLGLYNYWLGAKAKIIRFLPFAKDSRKEGIQQIKLAIEKGRFLKIDAMFGLAAAYYNEGEFEQALAIMDRLYQEYPNNPTLLYRRGRTFQKLGRWSEAKKTFDELHELIGSAKFQSVSYQIECLYQSAKCQYELQEMFDAQRLCREAIALEKQCDFSKELDGPLEKFSEIKKQLHKLNQEIESNILTELSSAKKE